MHAVFPPLGWSFYVYIVNVLYAHTLSYELAAIVWTKSFAMVLGAKWQILAFFKIPFLASWKVFLQLGLDFSLKSCETGLCDFC